MSPSTTRSPMRSTESRNQRTPMKTAERVITVSQRRSSQKRKEQF
jgi:hypothetical protein